MSSWLLRSASYVTLYLRTYMQRNGAAPVVFAAMAVVALVVSWRRRAAEAAAERERQRRDRGEGVDDTTPLVSAPGGMSVSRKLMPTTTGAGRPAALAGVRKVTIGGEVDDGPLFTREQKDGSKIVCLAPKVAETLCRLAKIVDLYIITKVDSDEEEQSVREALKESGLYSVGGANPAKSLFCETVIGRVSIVRQLEPQLHIDCDAEVVGGLQRFVKQVSFISTGPWTSTLSRGPNVFSGSSVSYLFD